MSSYEKKLFYEVLENVKFLDEFASNISRCIIKHRKLSGLKSHDCHVLIQQLFAIVLRGTLPEKVTSVLIELCSFFREICLQNSKSR